MNLTEEKKTRLLAEIFVLAFVTSLAVTWYTMIVRKDYIVFTDETTVPAPTDFFAPLFGADDVEDE